MIGLAEYRVPRNLLYSVFPCKSKIVLKVIIEKQVKRIWTDVIIFLHPLLSDHSYLSVTYVHRYMFVMMFIRKMWFGIALFGRSLYIFILIFVIAITFTFKNSSKKWINSDQHISHLEQSRYVCWISADYFHS